MLLLRPAPSALVDEAGAVQTGVFAEPCGKTNLDRARLRWAGGNLPRWLARLRFKQWQHFALVLPEAFLGVAVVDLGWMRASWCHLRPRSGGPPTEHARRGPLLDAEVAAELSQGRTWARARGYRVEIENELEAGWHRLHVEVAARGPRPALQASLRCLHDRQTNHPLTVCMPVGPGRYMYSHKAVLPLEGEIALGGSGWRADPARSFAILDVHKAYYPRHTLWEWATLAGRLTDGRWLGLNLTRNGNSDDARINENALWLDGAIQHLGPARFERSADDPMQPWRISVAGDELDLGFAPEAGRHERLRLGLIRSVFHQLQGKFRGAVRFGGERLPVEGLFGLCEDHDSVW